MKAIFGGITAAATLALATPASAVPFTFDFSGAGVNVAGPGGGTSDGNARTYTASSGGVQVRATGWSNNGTVIQDSYLGSYSGGLGVTSGDEDGSGNTHTIDNQNRQDMVVLQFSTAVNLTKGTFTTFDVAPTGGMDGDASVYYSDTSTTPWNADLAGLNGMSAADFDALVYPDPPIAVPWLLGGTEDRTINAAGIYKNVWIVAASELSDGGTDGFKLKGLQGNTYTPPTGSVPEPATWLMMISGFGFVGASLRRRNHSTVKTVTA